MSRASGVVRGVARDNLPQWFWHRAQFWTALGVLGWLVLTCFVVWFARDLDRWTIAQVPAGYWWAAQGAIGGFLVIIVVYCGVMERLEAQFWADEASADAQSTTDLGLDSLPPSAEDRHG
jgi:putative solute:sodium symporter small subunit